MNIKPIMNSIGKTAHNVANKSIDFANDIVTRAMESKTGNTWMPENPTDIAKFLALVSTTTKDGVNCYYYTTQSYTNEKIPEDKRKFVAGIDLANGILNVITQLTLGLFVNKQSDNWFEKMFKGGIAPTPDKIEKYKKAANELLQKSSLTKHIQCSDQEILDAIKKSNKIAKGGFGVIAVLIVTQIIAKRMIVPFLSTPLAGYFKNYLDKRTAKANNAVAPSQPELNSQSKVENANQNPLKINVKEEHEAFKGFEKFLNNK